MTQIYNGRLPVRDYAGFRGHRLRESQRIRPRLLAARATRAPAGAPNVVVMLMDDMGYSDIAPFGGEIHTPALAEPSPRTGTGWAITRRRRCARRRGPRC